MRFREPVALRDLAQLTGADIVGNTDAEVLGINEIHRIEKGELVFVDHPKYYDKALSSVASFVLINKKVDVPEGKSLLVLEHPFEAFNQIIRRYFPRPLNIKTIGENTKIAPSATVHETVAIGNNVQIGENSVIYPNVVIYDDVEIGSNTIIHGNTVLGSHAFYYKKTASGYDPLLTCGRLIIGDRVEIGANCAIDKGVTANTVIGNGTKIDNLVHIAHDTIVGENCLFASQVGIAGCVNIEDNVTLWGQAGIAAGVTIRKNAVMLAQAGTNKDLESNIAYFGTPAINSRIKFREIAMIKKLPEVLDFIRKNES